MEQSEDSGTDPNTSSTLVSTLENTLQQVKLTSITHKLNHLRKGI